MDYDAFKAIKIADQQKRASARSCSAALFNQAAELAHTHGMTLKKHSDVHYQLSHHAAGWMMNLYPGNGRITDGRKRTQPPHIEAIDWDLLSLVKEVIEVTA